MEMEKKPYINPGQNFKGFAMDTSIRDDHSVESISAFIARMVSPVAHNHRHSLKSSLLRVKDESGFCSARKSNAQRCDYENYRRIYGYESSWGKSRICPKIWNDGVDDARKYLWGVQDHSSSVNASPFRVNPELNFITTPPRMASSLLTSANADSVVQTIAANYDVKTESLSSNTLSDHSYLSSNEEDERVQNSCTGNPWVNSSPSGFSSVETNDSSTTIDDNVVNSELLVSDGVFSDFEMNGEKLIEDLLPITQHLIKDEHRTMVSDYPTSSPKVKFLNRLLPKRDSLTRYANSARCLAERASPVMPHLSFPHHSPIPSKETVFGSPAIPGCRPNVALDDALSCPSLFSPKATSTPSHVQLSSPVDPNGLTPKQDDTILASNPSLKSTDNAAITDASFYQHFKPLSAEVESDETVSLSDERKLDSSDDTIPAAGDDTAVKAPWLSETLGEAALLKRVITNDKMDTTDTTDTCLSPGFNLASLVEKLKKRTNSSLDLTSAESNMNPKEFQTCSKRSPKLRFTAAWAEQRSGLWQFQFRESLDAEKSYNKNLGNRKPHCAVCQFLVNPNITNQSSNFNGPPVVLPVKSVPAINQLLKHKGRKRRLSPVKVAAMASMLLQCRNCLVVVHADCYQSNVPRLDHLAWECDACLLHPGGLDCSLCSLRGGPLKRTSSGDWVHLFCYFAASAGRPCLDNAAGDLDLQRIPLHVMKRTCSLCADAVDANEAFYSKGACVTCQDLTCSSFFHPTCALFCEKVTVSVEIDRSYETPTISFSFCCYGAHEFGREFNSTSDLFKDLDAEEEFSKDTARPCDSPLVLGQTVVAPFKNRKHVLSRVVAIRPKRFYKVYFEDGTVSRDVLPSDIVNFACGPDYDPPLRAKVFVKWEDGATYAACFLGGFLSEEVDVESLTDGTQETTTRSSVVPSGAGFPKKSKERVVVDKVTSPPSSTPLVSGKRIRKVNRKYDNDDTIRF